MNDFALHPRLAADTFAVADLSLSRVLLMNDNRFPWLVLVPRLPDAREIIDLAPANRLLLAKEIDRAADHPCAYALADRHAHSCADVHVRAWLHAPYHARCGLTGTHAQACTTTHTHTTAHAHAQAHSHGTPRIMSVTELFTSAPGPRWDCADTGPHPRRD